MARLLALGSCSPFAEWLEQRGDQVDRASSKLPALILARELNSDLIVLGVDDPASTEALTRQIRTDPTSELIPVVTIVEARVPEQIQRLLEAGASAVIAAATEKSELFGLVDMLMRMRGIAERRIEEARRTTVVELAGAVAHRINQPLTAMSVIVETLTAQESRDDLTPERLRLRLHELRRLVDRMAKIVKQVANLDEYRTTPYVGAVRIIDLERPPTGKPRREQD